MFTIVPSLLTMQSEFDKRFRIGDSEWFTQILCCNVYITAAMFVSWICIKSAIDFVHVSLHDLTHYMQQFFYLSLFIVVLFKCITSLQPYYLRKYSFCVRYFNLLLVICTVLYGVLCLISMNQSHISSTDQLSICINCVYLILSSIVSVQYLRPSSDTHLFIAEHLHSISFRLFVLSFAIFVLTHSDCLSSYPLWIYLVQCMIFKGSALSTKNLCIYWIVFGLGFIDRNMPREKRTNVVEAVYFVATMCWYKTLIQRHCTWNDEQEKKQSIYYRFISYICLSLSILFFLEAHLMWNRGESAQDFFHIRCAEYVICFIVFVSDFDDIANKVNTKLNPINSAMAVASSTSPTRIFRPVKQKKISRRLKQLKIIGIKLTLLFIAIKLCPFIVLSHFKIHICVMYAKQRIILTIQLMLYKVVCLLMDLVTHAREICLEASTEQRLHANK